MKDRILKYILIALAAMNILDYREHYTHIGPRLQIFFTLFYDIFQQF